MLCSKNVSCLLFSTFDHQHDHFILATWMLYRRWSTISILVYYQHRCLCSFLIRQHTPDRYKIVLHRKGTLKLPTIGFIYCPLGGFPSVAQLYCCQFVTSVTLFDFWEPYALFDYSWIVKNKFKLGSLVANHYITQQYLNLKKPLFLAAKYSLRVAKQPVLMFANKSVLALYFSTGLPKITVMASFLTL